jgi:hypothetical protein
MADIETKQPDKASGGAVVSAAGGFARSLYEIFTDPAKVFARIDAGLPWWKPFIVVSVVAMAIGYIMVPFRRQAVMPTLQQLPPEQMEQALENMRRFGAVGIVAIPIIMIVLYLIIAGITHIVINVMSQRASFKKTLSLLFFCGLIPLVEQIIATAIIASRGVESVESMADLKMSLGFAALMPNASGALVALAESLSLFQIWYYVVLVLGIAAIFKLSRKQAVIGILPIWLISFLMLLLGSKVGGGFGG